MLKVRRLLREQHPGRLPHNLCAWLNDLAGNPRLRRRAKLLPQYHYFGFVGCLGNFTKSRHIWICNSFKKSKWYFQNRFVLNLFCNEWWNLPNWHDLQRPLCLLCYLAIHERFWDCSKVRAHFNWLFQLYDCRLDLLYWRYYYPDCSRLNLYNYTSKLCKLRHAIS